MYERYCKLRDGMGFKDKDIAERGGFTQSTFSDWKKGKSSPNADKLLKIAQCLNVSMEYLMTGQESKYTLTAFEYALVLAYRQADDIGQAMVDRALGLEEKKKEAVITA